MKKKKIETKEQTTSGGSGSVESPLFGEFTKKEFNEAVTADSSGSYDVPFGDGGKDPLKINGVKSIKSSRAVKDKNFPKFGGKDSVFVQINDKCKKYPYCNQGDPKNLQMYEGIDEVVKQISEERNIPIKIINQIILNELN